jgi:hypothetical protein
MKKLSTIIITLFIALSWSKSISTDYKIPKTTKSEKFVDSLVEDFNGNGKKDRILIAQKKEKLKLLLYIDGNKSPKIISKKILFNVGDLGSSGTESITLSFEKKVITISQEFGSARPDGFCNVYISSAENIFLIDSISIWRKKWEEERATMTVKSKIIHKPIEKVNAVKEFKTLW